MRRAQLYGASDSVDVSIEVDRSTLLDDGGMVGGNGSLMLRATSGSEATMLPPLRSSSAGCCAKACCVANVVGSALLAVMWLAMFAATAWCVVEELRDGRARKR